LVIVQLFVKKHFSSAKLTPDGLTLFIIYEMLLFLMQSFDYYSALLCQPIATGSLVQHCFGRHFKLNNQGC